MNMVGLNIKPYCTCHATGTWQKQDGYRLDPSSGWWVHGRCHKPSRMNYERHAVGLPQIPQQRKPEDIYDKERRYEANKEVSAELEELGWNEDEEEWDLIDE